MSEAGDYTPAPCWSGHNFKSARRAYDDVVDRSYNDAVSKGVDRGDLVPDSLTTDCEAPLVIVCDVTGSMGEWPATIFSKLPYLEFEAKEYLGEGCEISFCAVGDCYSDRYPLQVQPFVDGSHLKESLNALVHEKGGGGQIMESYDLAAVYYARNVKFPKAIRKPIIIFIGDESLYDYVDKANGEEWARTTFDKQISVEQAFEELKAKYAVYVVRKPYNSYGGGGDSMSDTDQKIQKRWAGLLGSDHIAPLPDAGRVVDVIFGILAKETGRCDYFKRELEDRQLPDKGGDKKVAMVMKSLHTIHALNEDKNSKKKLGGPKSAKSVTKRSKDEKDLPHSISLLDD